MSLQSLNICLQSLTKSLQCLNRPAWGSKIHSRHAGQNLQNLNISPQTLNISLQRLKTSLQSLNISLQRLKKSRQNLNKKSAKSKSKSAKSKSKSNKSEPDSRGDQKFIVAMQDKVCKVLTCV